jgi:hypothetical protein
MDVFQIAQANFDGSATSGGRSVEEVLFSELHTSPWGPMRGTTGHSATAA